MKKCIISVLSILAVTFFVGCSKQQIDSPVTNDTETLSQTIFSQNVSALQLISNSVLNSEHFSFETNDISSLSNILDEKIKESYPLAFSYQSITKTKAGEIESICSLIPSNCISELRESIFDINEFHEIKAKYLQSEDFLCLSKMEQDDIINYLNTVELCRDTMFETAFEIANTPVTKVSGAEMRGWSEMAKQMDNKDRDMVVDVMFYTYAGIFGGGTGWVIAGIGLLISWLR